MHDLGWLLSNFGEWKETRHRKDPKVSDWITKHKIGRYVLILWVFFDSHAIAVVDGKILGHYEDEWPILSSYRHVSD